ncbi:hypothetical protein C7S18_17725 [Ahniella affigens]|uniref:ORC1/DEAH AAA+ ATPase domain-containing protein n=1 Tax=Ahniella affigens TaxID=2021234 RepID=A0A2P1PVU4_9GAMM|nr:ATP-binding protein [Ahniella affigens]AVP98904.1 hypothetical protein C7S18_17725 [Ahniella affigens]
MNNDWKLRAAESLATTKIQHHHYERAVNDLFNALAVALPGEVVVIVGPSRVGKSRALAEALNLLVGTLERGNESPVIKIDAENAGRNGAFSTKDFMRSACEAIGHPIYGFAGSDDPNGMKLAARIERTSEGMLRSAFEKFVVAKSIQYVCVDESHHIEYIQGGSKNAAKVLDSWKCLAHKTQTVLVLVGSYRLLGLLALAPHLLGRQRPIEFPRYREENPDDLEAFEAILTTLSNQLRLGAERQDLRQWNELLFNWSLGCVGHLALWLRTALGRIASRGLSSLNRETLEQTRLPASQAAQILAETLQGEHDIKASPDREAPEQSPGYPSGPRLTAKQSKTSAKPFRAKPARHKAGGRL